MPHRRRFPLASVLPLFLLALALPSAARATDVWQPLDLSTHWRYASDLGGGEDAVITGTTTILGRTVTVKHFTGGSDDGLDQYWLTDENGSVLLAGFNRTDGSFALAYDPPLTQLQAPPVLGAGWTDISVAYELPDLAFFTNLNITWVIYEEGDLTLPYGTVHAFGVGQYVLAHGPSFAVQGGAIGLDGRRIEGDPSTATSNTTDWFTANIGLVQYHSNAFHRLVAFDHSLLAAAPSWGRIKRLYRGR